MLRAAVEHCRAGNFVSICNEFPAVLLLLNAFTTPILPGGILRFRADSLQKHRSFCHTPAFLVTLSAFFIPCGIKSCLALHC
ncbi:hypothetical protein MASSI9I_20265 [Massilia sp. 9I]|nr:hypothetical protein MASSI9I_20265 [Massilia sp. 9I]